jgi:hypothetical protein
MAGSTGPKIPINNLLFTYQPGHNNEFNKIAPVTTGSDVAPPTTGKIIGPRRTSDYGYGPAYDDIHNNIGPIMNIQTITDSIYKVNTLSNTYSISLWVKIISFPTKYTLSASSRGTTNTTRLKQTSIARFNYFGDTNPYDSGFIEFAAQAPYYKDIYGNITYKSVFEPISFGVKIQGFNTINSNANIHSIYTDYKFSLNKWYLLTLQLEGDLTFPGDFTTPSDILFPMTNKFFVNGVQENIGISKGNIFSRNSKSQHWHNKGTFRFKPRTNGVIATHPGFLNYNNVLVNNSTSVMSTFNLYTRKNPNTLKPINLSKLNNINFSPTKLSLSQYFCNSGINFGLIYIYNSEYNNSLYTSFKHLYT